MHPVFQLAILPDDLTKWASESREDGIDGCRGFDYQLKVKWEPAQEPLKIFFLQAQGDLAGKVS